MSQRITHHRRFIEGNFQKFTTLDLPARKRRDTHARSRPPLLCINPMTRDEAIAIIRRTGPQEPRGDIEKFCAFAGIDVARFFEIAEKFRNPDVWKREADIWVIPDFLVSDWNWK